MTTEAQTLWIEEPPPYERPTMTDVRAVPWNGLTCVGSFSGAGGSSLGLRMSGWRVPYAIEFVPAAADTYEANSDAYVDRRDVRKIRGYEILDRLGLYRGQLDLFESSPPCASFSSAGNREKSWGKEKSYSDTKQRTDDLFFEFARLLDELNPRAFIAENVPGLIMGGAVTEYAHKISAALSKLGYRVQARVLNAANYGVPQERRRLIFVGLRNDVEGTWEYPAPTTPIPHTTRQALESVDPEDPDHAPFLAESMMTGKAVARTWRLLRDRSVTGRAYGDGAEAPERFCDRCGEDLEAHEITKRTHADGVFPRGRPQKAICADGASAQIVKEYFMLTVPDLDAPCPTLTATGSQVGAASVVHPLEPRKFTPSEAKALCGFPPDFRLTGSRAQRYERCGRAVMPPLYEAVGRRLAEILSAR